MPDNEAAILQALEGVIRRLERAHEKLPPNPERPLVLGALRTGAWFLATSIARSAGQTPAEPSADPTLTERLG